MQATCKHAQHPKQRNLARLTGARADHAIKNPDNWMCNGCLFTVCYLARDGGWKTQRDASKQLSEHIAVGIGAGSLESNMEKVHNIWMNDECVLE